VLAHVIPHTSQGVFNTARGLSRSGLARVEARVPDVRVRAGHTREVYPDECRVTFSVEKVLETLLYTQIWS
jgi:hypothetical protein